MISDDDDARIRFNECPTVVVPVNVTACTSHEFAVNAVLRCRCSERVHKEKKKNPNDP